MRASAYHLSTTRETPADAEIVSHQLMIRTGMIRNPRAPGPAVPAVSLRIMPVRIMSWWLTISASAGVSRVVLRW